MKGLLARLIRATIHAGFTLVCNGVAILVKNSCFDRNFNPVIEIGNPASIAGCGGHWICCGFGTGSLPS